ncbi:MAG: substrate-binding domain-containing protein [Xanthobacteraceae bacterium]
MIARVRACLLTALCVLGFSGGAALGADIKVMSGGAPKEVLAILTPEFEKKTGHKVHFTYIVINAMQQKLAAGEKPDMVLMPVPAIEARVKNGMFRSDGWTALGTVSIGLIVRKGAPKPDIASLESFKKAMLDAKSIAHANPAATPSGAHFAKVWDQLGIADALKGKLTFRNALDGGVSAVSKGEAEIGLYPLSEVLHDDGVTVVGLIPPDVQLNNVYGTAVLKANETPEPALAFVKFLADPSNAKHWKDGGFGPAASR